HRRVLHSRDHFCNGSVATRRLDSGITPRSVGRPCRHLRCTCHPSTTQVRRVEFGTARGRATELITPDNCAFVLAFGARYSASDQPSSASTWSATKPSSNSLTARLDLSR